MNLDVVVVPPVAEMGEMALDPGMLDGEATVIRLQVAFGHVSLMLGSVWQDVIPRTVLGRPRTGHGFVPFLSTSKVRVDVDDHTAIGEQFVLNHITN